jgi:gliding motility-associated-like protein
MPQPPLLIIRKLLTVCFFFFLVSISRAQFTPIPISGYNHDVVAEAGTSSMTNTTIPLDGVTVSNKVMYSNTFKTTNGFGGGGIPDNGVITDAAGSYQLAPYTGNNVLLLQRGQNGDLNLTTPAKFTTIRILCFSTEGTSAVNATLFFTDGSTLNALTNYQLSDWFNATTNLVSSGFGRCTRATPTGTADAYPTNPRFYYIEINLSCANQQKNLQKINFANVTTAGNNAPYPNAVFWAISGKTYTQNISANITQATCTSTGSAALTVTGSTSPYTYSWNTTPVQTGSTATNLAPGNYQATITDANGCTTLYPVTITLQNNLSLTAHIDTIICNAASFNANTVSNATSYSWSPTTGVSNPNIANPILSPTSDITYTVTGTLGTCSISRSFHVTVGAALNLNVGLDTIICRGTSFTRTVVTNAGNITWSPVTGVSNPNIVNPVLSPQTTTPYTITAFTGNCSVQKSFTVTVVTGATVNAGPDATIIAGDVYQMQGSGSAGTYLWTPATGLSATNILNPNANPTSTTIYNLKVTTPQGCTVSDDMTLTVIPYCIKVMEAFTPNGDGINDLWLITNGNCLVSATVQVFNRYGSKVFESNDYRNTWNGTYKGKPLPDGTYYYIVSYKLINGKSAYVKGNVTILR